MFCPAIELTKVDTLLKKTYIKVMNLVYLTISKSSFSNLFSIKI